MLEISKTGHLLHFKQLIGHTNHYLITILIGLEGVRTGVVTKGDTFNVVWNPESVEESVKRSRRFARSAALAWTIDALDAYIGFLRKYPFKFTEPFQTEFQNERFIYNSFNKLIQYLGYPIDLPLCLVQLGIQWRNNLIHYNANNVLDQDYVTYIRELEDGDIIERFRGLDPQLMLDNFNNHQAPTFKEIASIIQSTHFIVLELDKKLIEFIDLDLFTKEIFESNEDEVISIIKSSPDKRESRMKQFLISNGFKEVENTSSNSKINDVQIRELIKNLRTTLSMQPSNAGQRGKESGCG